MGARIVDYRQASRVYILNIQHVRTILLDCSLCYDVSLSRSDLLGSLSIAAIHETHPERV